MSIPILRCVLAVCCLLADGHRCEITDAIKLHVKVLSFSWDHEFKMLKGGLFPVILGLNFVDCTKMLVDVASRKFSFVFTSGCIGAFLEWKLIGEGEPLLQNFCEEHRTWRLCWTSGIVG